MNVLRSLRRWLGGCRDVTKGYLFQCLTAFRWAIRARERPRHSLDLRVVVSLTSYPPRFDVLPLTLKCLLMQSVRPDVLVLWVASNDQQFLTSEILALQDEGLEIRTCDDIGSYKKIVPALDAFPDACIVTADDDLYYAPTWLEVLTENVDDNEQTVPCHRMHRIHLDERGFPLPYLDWALETRESNPSPLNFPTSGGGVLYPPDSLSPEVTDRSQFLALCPTADDIWLYWMLRRRDRQAKRVVRFSALVMWPGSQASRLWEINSRENDRQMQAMSARFGFPGRLTARGEGE